MTKINLVADPAFGADPTNTTDSTAAFVAAPLAIPAVAIVPPGTYKINNLVVPSGACLIGYSAFGYGGVGTDNQTILVALNSSNRPRAERRWRFERCCWRAFRSNATTP